MTGLFSPLYFSALSSVKKHLKMCIRDRFLALHFICALRGTDLEQLGHPQLPRTPKEVLKSVRSGEMCIRDR